jgi:hypothetical protein
MRISWRLLQELIDGLTDDCKLSFDSALGFEIFLIFRKGLYTLGEALDRLDRLGLFLGHHNSLNHVLSLRSPKLYAGELRSAKPCVGELRSPKPRVGEHQKPPNRINPNY